jgi:subtilase family serine protease
VQHGNANFPCSDPTGTDSGETALDTEWSGALAPAAQLIIESCSGATGVFQTEIQALVDANVADIISSSIGFSEPNVTLGNVQAFDTAFAQAAAQGQTVPSAQGDSGSDDVDFGAPQGTHGLSLDYPGSSPLVLSVGGTDFQDQYDAAMGGVPVSTYWGPNTPANGSALSYIPDTVWDDSCANTMVANNQGGGVSPTFIVK